MTPELFTRATLARIRAESGIYAGEDIAKGLGWDIPRLQRVCRAHGIGIRIREQLPPPMPLPPPSIRFTLSIRDVAWRYKDKTIDEIVALLPGRQGQVLRVLDMYGRDTCLSRTDIAAYVNELEDGGPKGFHFESVRNTVERLAARLRATRWEIQHVSAKGSNRLIGGYRLVEK